MACFVVAAVVARELRDGRVVLDAIALDCGARRTILSVPSPSGLPGRAMLAASPQRLVLVVPMRDRTGIEVAWRLYSGPPSGPLELEPGAGWVPLAWIRGGDAAVAIAGPSAAVLPAGRAVARAPRCMTASPAPSKRRSSGAARESVDTARGVQQPVLVAADGTHRPLSVPTGWVADLAADERGVAWPANGCVRYAAVAGPAPAGPASDPCPTTEIGLILTNESRLRGRDVRMPVLCISAPDGVCRGTVSIRHRGRTSAAATSRSPPVSARGSRPASTGQDWGSCGGATRSCASLRA